MIPKEEVFRLIMNPDTHAATDLVRCHMSLDRVAGNARRIFARTGIPDTLIWFSRGPDVIDVKYYTHASLTVLGEQICAADIDTAPFLNRRSGEMTPEMAAIFTPGSGGQRFTSLAAALQQDYIQRTLLQGYQTVH